MKKRCLSFILCLFLICSFFSTVREKAHAEALTMSMVTSAIYMIAQSSGMTWDFGTANGPGAFAGLENDVNNWLGGRTLTDAFGSELIRMEAGRLFVPMQVFNGAVSFLNSIAQRIDAGESPVITGYVGETPIGAVSSNFGVNNGSFYASIYSNNGSVAYFQGNYNGTADKYRYGTPSGGQKKDLTPLGYQVIGLESNANNQVRAHYNVVYLVDVYKDAQWVTTQTSISWWGNYMTTGAIAYSSPAPWNSQDYDAPDILIPGEGWLGQVDGAPDTNLQDYMDHIFDGAADNNLDVDGEVVPDVPPTPVPTMAPGISDIIDGLDDANVGLDDLIDAVGQQTATLDGTLTDTVEGIQDIVDILTAPEIEERTFDLTELFPFCIPFDIYHLLQKFDATPQAPHVQLPIVIPSIGFSYTLDLDFSPWNPVAAAMRTVELIVYALGLAWATSKVIKW